MVHVLFPNVALSFYSIHCYNDKDIYFFISTEGLCFPGYFRRVITTACIQTFLLTFSMANGYLYICACSINFQETAHMKGKKKYFYVCQLIWTDVNIMCKDLWLIDTDSKLEPNNFQYVRDITMACVYLFWRIKINDTYILQSCVLLINVRKINCKKFFYTLYK